MQYRDDELTSLLSFIGANRLGRRACCRHASSRRATERPSRIFQRNSSQLSAISFQLLLLTASLLTAAGFFADR
jgi:hypothetical protein